MPRRDVKNHADYVRVVVEQVDCAVDPSLAAMPVGRNLLARMAQRFGLVKAVHNHAQKLYNDARAEIISHAHIPPEPGTHMVCDSPHVMLTAQVTAPVRRLDETLLVNMLMERLELDAPEADALLDTCRLAGDPVTKLQVVLKK